MVPVIINEITLRVRPHQLDWSTLVLKGSPAGESGRSAGENLSLSKNLIRGAAARRLM